jgi:hypothetical protein
MATTTNYGWTTPDDTALVKDGAAAIRTLGSSVDTTTKALNPSTTLGDIEYRSSTANTNTRLGIGTTGQLLSVSGGVPAWATVSTGAETLISTTTLTGSSITLSSIPSTYNSIKLVIRNYKPANDNEWLFMRLNSDTNTRYNAFPTQSNNSGETAATFGDNIFLLARNDNTSAEGLAVIEFFDYANAVTWKMGRILGIFNNATTATSFNPTNKILAYNQTAAISSVTLFPDTGTFTSGTVLLYGVK